MWGYCSLLGVGIWGICVVCGGSGHFSTRPEKIKKCPHSLIEPAGKT